MIPCIEMAWDGGYKDLQAPQVSTLCGVPSLPAPAVLLSGARKAAWFPAASCCLRVCLPHLLTFCCLAACSPGAHVCSRHTSGEGLSNVQPRVAAVLAAVFCPATKASPAHPLPCCCPLQLSTNGSVLALVAGTPTAPRPRVSSTSLWCEVSSCSCARTWCTARRPGRVLPRKVGSSYQPVSSLYPLGRQQCAHTGHWRAGITAASLCALCPPSPRPARGSPLLLSLPLRLDI